VRLKLDFAYQGGPKELGKAAVVTMTVNGKKVAQGQLPKTIPATMSIGEGMDIGEDVGSAVDFNYKLPFKFTGKIEKVIFELK
jgi:arylsulfatase